MVDAPKQTTEGSAYVLNHHVASRWLMGFLGSRRCLLLGATALLAVSGCVGAELGACDEAEATRVVFDPNGFPAYAGQAQLRVSCGNGAFCHSEAADRRNRFGVPVGLNFDMGLATTNPGPAREETERLRRGVTEARDRAEILLAEVESERMPPFGEPTITAHAGVPRYAFDGGERLRQPDTVEGLEIFRNWLACGAPVVERTTPRPAGVVPVGDIVAAKEDPIEPTFSSIYTRFIFPTCGSSCHGPTVPDQLAISNLDMSEQNLAYNNLVNQVSMGDACSASGVTRVVPRQPDVSLLAQKVGGTQSCGDAMPLGGSTPAEIVTVIRQWISDGALNN